ncbi:hypothetical protein A2619_01990 [candidate division WWE3 bacterium RIFOXYD1_FULL_39_9]|uniref:Uncharacterized protein n=1 Tax=candidate division WWE3 bacterium RIFOXYD1_FULL_39_9 TaxID=1802649 RepID=A0A1F4X4W0_UNCKA|nr:MAG: hypothetical protein A2619_01990 [candidate division WWE3 bacterium RIFOXYD1_FULL_39_9]
MSTELVRNNQYSIVRFYGGDRRGPCIQITSQTNDPYIQLTAKQLEIFIQELRDATESLKGNNETFI